MTSAFDSDAYSPAFISNRSVYIAGYDSTATQDIPCYWVDGTRHDLDIDGTGSGTAYAITVANGVVYTACVTFVSRTPNPCYWIGDTRQSLGGTSDGACANTMIVSGGTIYSAGYFFDAALGHNVACFWEGTTFHSLLGGLTHEALIPTLDSW